MRVKFGFVSERMVQRTVLALAGVAQWIECQPVNQSRAHAWVVGRVPSRGALEKQPHIDVSLPLFLPPSPNSLP